MDFAKIFKELKTDILGLVKEKFGEDYEDFKNEAYDLI